MRAFLGRGCAIQRTSGMALPPCSWLCLRPWLLASPCIQRSARNTPLSVCWPLFLGPLLCTPAAAVLSAFAIQLVAQGVPPVPVVLMMASPGVLTGLIQLLIGFLGIGNLIKYLPYPVVSGYSSGVVLIIIGGQLPKFAGAPAGSYWLEVLLTPHQCQRCGQNGF